jgi:hypothetical protein
MSRELRDIPPAPRRVRWRAVVWQRFGLGLGGAVLLGYGGILTLLLWIGDRSSHYALASAELDAGPVRVVDGEVVAVEARNTWRGQPADLVSYRFGSGGDQQRGRSFTAPGLAQVGTSIEVEHLDGDPGLSRVLGGELYARPAWQEAALRVTVAPGAALLAAWWLGVLRLRRTLRRGDSAVAEPYAVRRLTFMVPTMLEVRFRFRDRQARVREGRHWVRARSELGERLTTTGRRTIEDGGRVLGRPVRPGSTPPVPDWRIERSTDLPRLCVVHDRGAPQRHRLVAAADFEHASERPRVLPPRAWLG